MLNPQSPFHRRLGRFLFWLPSYQRRWQQYMGRFMPILTPAFEYNETARLLVMKALKQIERKNFNGAASTIKALYSAAREGNSADRALCYFLMGLNFLQKNDKHQAFRNFKSANQFNHRLFLPYLITADHYMNTNYDYPKAEADFRTAIECIYEFPRLNENTRLPLCAAHADLCFCHVMMHKYDEAKEDLLHAEQMVHDNASTLYSRIYLHAALRQASEAAALLPRYKALCPEEFDDFKARIERILVEQDSHFTQLPIGSPEGIAAFWQNFLDREYEMMELIRNKRRKDARELALGPLRKMDCYTNVYYGFDLSLRDGMFNLFFSSKYSRTYTPWIDAILAACPAQIRERWNIIREP